MSFYSLWNGTEFELLEEPLLCPFAQKFFFWTEELIKRAEKEPSIVLTYQSMLMLLIKYMDWRTVVPKSHRNRIGEVGHRCIWHVFEQGYHRLKAIELALTPPLPFLPPQPAPQVSSPPQKPSLGIFIGELDKPLG